MTTGQSALLSISIITAIACTKMSESKTRDQTDKKGLSNLEPVADISLSEYNPATYTFDGTLTFHKAQTGAYDGRDLFCNHMHALNQGYAGTAIVPAFDYKSGTRLITCWDNLDGLVSNLKKDLTYTVRVGSRLKCDPGADKDRVKCHRIDELDRQGNRYELFKGMRMLVGPNKGGPFADRISLQPGVQFNTSLSLHGVTAYDGSELYCANKKLVTINEITYVRDPFPDSVGIPSWDSVNCYFSKEALNNTFTDKIKFGSKVRCPVTAEDVAQTQCTFVEEVSE